jgi:outer membrane protein OmpA-like peptidoglycan-associated protein
MKKIYYLLIGLILASPAFSQELPKNGTPGKCYVKCITPDKFEEVKKTIVVEEAYTVLETKPPTYKTTTEEVLVKEESKKLEVIPAVYETVEVEYISKEEAEKLNVIPASFVDDFKKLQIYPKTGRWEYKMLEDCPSADKDDCMVACYVEYPKQMQTVKLKNLEKDASTEPEAIPEKTSVYEKQVVKTPARVEEKIIPAKYETITKKVVDEEAKVIEKTIPEVTKTVTITNLVEKGGMTVWEEVDCGLLGKNNILPILYDYNSARITADSKGIIDNNLLKLMKDKPGLNIEILSHTDSRGNSDYNKSLSQQRAQSVVNYLVNKGIDRERLVAKGLGETQLLNRCADGVECTEEEHQKNRRTEFRIIQGK